MWQIFHLNLKVDFEKQRVSTYFKWNVLEIIKFKGIQKSIWNNLFYRRFFARGCSIIFNCLACQNFSRWLSTLTAPANIFVHLSNIRLLSKDTLHSHFPSWKFFQKQFFKHSIQVRTNGLGIINSTKLWYCR